MDILLMLLCLAHGLAVLINEMIASRPDIYKVDIIAMKVEATDKI
jgi:hypothetical protein